MSRLTARHVGMMGLVAAVAAGATGAGHLALRDGAKAETFACNGQQMTRAEIARFRGISVETMDLIRQNRSLLPEDVCSIKPALLARAIDKSTNLPGTDRPDKALEDRLQSYRDDSGKIDYMGLAKARAQVARMKAAKGDEIAPAAGIEPGYWNWHGPGNIGGRVRTIAIHPTNHDVMFAGSVGGGIWKTTNGGGSWAPVDDFMASLAVTSIIYDPSNPNVMYAGTGETGFRNADALRGEGIFRSLNGGATWTQLPSTSNAVLAVAPVVANCSGATPPNPCFSAITRLAMSPDGTVLLASASSGIYRSLNAGASWLRVYTDWVTDVDFHPTDSTKVVAGRAATPNGNNSLYSNDGGATWTLATMTPAPSQTGNMRVETAISTSNPLVVYASVNASSGQIYKSVDGGVTYNRTHSGSAYLGAQGWYDNIIWIDPTNPNVVIVGGIDLWRSMDGGVSLTKISQWQNGPPNDNKSAHADHHFVIAHPQFDGSSNTRVFFGNDGGVFKTENVYSVGPVTNWVNLNNNLGITQYYGAGANPTTGTIVGGTQDNGTLTFSHANGPQLWTPTFGGDGGFSAADQDNPNYFYGEYVFLTIHRSDNGGFGSSYIHRNGQPGGIADANATTGCCANFIAPFILDPNNQARMLAGGLSLWRTEDARAATVQWTNIKAQIGASAATFAISAIAVAPGNPDLIYVGHNNGAIYKTINGTQAVPTWTVVDSAASLVLPNRKVLRITIDPNNDDVVYFAFGSFNGDNIYKTINGTAPVPTYTDATGGTSLPNVPVRSVVVNASNSNWIYAGTEIGVFTSEDGGANWALPQDGPANVSVDELFFVGNNKLYAATHGRGVYSVNVSATQTAAVSFTLGASTVNEAAASAAVTVTLNTNDNAPLSGPVSVGYTTNDGTATAGSDYTTTAGTLTWNAGTLDGATRTIMVPIINDGSPEPTETFTVTLAAPVNATIDPPSTHTVSIIDNDTLPAMSIGDASGIEGNTGVTALSFPVTLSQPVGFIVTVPYSTADGTATAGSDYTAVAGTLTFTAGQTSATINVQVIADTTFEADETFFVNLGTPTNASIADGQGQGTIFNDESAPAGTGDGLRGAYYDNGDFTNEVLVRVDPTVDANYGAGTPDPAITDPESFSVRWTGVVETRHAEAYRFYVQSQDGARLWVNDQLMVNRPGEQALGEAQSVLYNFAAGERYSIRLEYEALTGDAQVHLRWSSPSTPKEIIPQSQLYSTSVVVSDRTDREGTSAAFTVSLSSPSNRTVTVPYGTANGTAGSRQTFTNPTGIILTDSPGVSNPNPSVVTVSGVAGVVSKATVTLNGLDHTYISDQIMILEGPQGQRIVLFGAAGGATDLFPPIDLVFDDHALQQVPIVAQNTAGVPFPSGTYRPGSLSFSFNVPGAPPQPYGGRLSDFNGTDPNGNWNLYTYDLGPGDAGVIASWSVTIETVAADYTANTGNLTFAPGQVSQTVTVPLTLDAVVEGVEDYRLHVFDTTNAGIGDGEGYAVGLIQDALFAEVSVTKVEGSDPVTVGSPLTYTIAFTNGGPDVAENAALADVLPAGTTFVSLASPAGWTCTTPAVGAAGTVTCTNVSMAVGTETFTLTVMVGSNVPAGTVISNTVGVSTTSNNTNTTNDSATETTTVAAAATTTTLVSSSNPSRAGDSVTFTATVNTAVGSPTGTVTFMDGATVIGSAPLVGNTATFSTSSLTQGSHSITAVYSGDSTHGASASAPLIQVITRRFPATTDFTGDGRSDIFWRHSGGDLFAWMMNGANLADFGFLTSIEDNWIVQFSGDFNNDGKADILWRDRDTGATYVWLMSGFGTIPGTGYTNSIADNSWTVVEVGDFNGDGNSDILWRQTAAGPNQGAMYVWFMNGKNIVSSTYLDPISMSWTVARTGDFNRDGKSDILWREATGATYIWMMNGATTMAGTGFTSMQVDNTFTIEGAADFDGNGSHDVLFRHASGSTHIWFMNGTTVTSTGTVAIPASSFIVGTGDFNGDGKADILSRDTASGATSVLLLDGLTPLAGSGPTNSSADNSWQIQLPR